MDLINQTASALHMPVKAVSAVIALLEEGAQIPFIARYRKDETGGLDEDAIRAIQEAWAYQNNLAQRKEAVLTLVREKGIHDETFEQNLAAAQTLAQVEDLYRPYKEKRKTKATAAQEAGLGPLAQTILEQKTPADQLGNAQELEMAGWILAEQFADNAQIRSLIKDILTKEASIVSKKKKDAQDEQERYSQYYDFSEKVSAIPPHRVLALDRAEKEKVVTVSIEADMDRIQNAVAKKIIRNDISRPYLEDVIHDALIRLLLPSLRREIRSTLREASQEKAIEGFGANLENLLMTRPLKGKRVLAWDPGFRNGCKLAVLDEYGNLLDADVVYPTAPRCDEAGTKRTLLALVDKHKVDLVVIGNGTASRESEAFVAKVLKERPGIQYVIGSEIGASVYSASAIAKAEFPDLAIEKRSAVSIGRRVQDPLAELVKIDPKSLGVGEYQHDVNQKRLQEMLDFVTDKAVNRVGVNVNTASPSLSGHIAGLRKPNIDKILKARPIASRKELESLLPPKVFEQAAGFLRIPDSQEPLDATGIHPESYEQARELADYAHVELSSMRQPDFVSAMKKVNPAAAAKALHIPAMRAVDIIRELCNPGLDPRDSLDGPLLKSDILKIEDLTPGMQLQGTVRNVTSFGAFVDIGLHENGLVHISKMASNYVKDPKDVVRTGQIVTVYVVQADPVRKRISLSLVPVN